MRKSYNKAFFKKFADGYQKYLMGDWASAEDVFAQCLRIRPRDGPANTLKSFIEQNNGTPPQNWAGFRELTEK
jgi:hypothetical protein